MPKPGRYNKPQLASMGDGTFTVYFDAEHPSSVNLPQVPNDAQQYVEADILPTAMDELTRTVGSMKGNYALPLDFER